MTDENYVKKEDCAAHREKIAKSVEETNKANVRTETKLNMALGILGAIGVVLVSIAAKVLFGG